MQKQANRVISGQVIIEDMDGCEARKLTKRFAALVVPLPVVAESGRDYALSW